MKFEIYEKKEKGESPVYFAIGASVFGPALITVDEDGRLTNTIASINDSGRLILHQNICPESGLDLTPNGQIKTQAD